MKKPVSKRRQIWTRTAIYSLMTVSVVVLVALLMLAVLGYSFNQRDGRLEQGGLLQFGSTPSGALVTLDELALGPRTNSKSTVTAGSHSVSFDRDSYRTWRKTITIEPGQIGWLNYARLIPLKTQSRQLQTFPVLSGALASPGRKWVLLHPVTDRPEFQLANIQEDTVRYTTIVLPEGSYTVPDGGGGQAFSLESWSQNENSVLIKHTYDTDKVEWLLLDRDDPDDSINLTAAYGIDSTKIAFAGYGDRLLFVQSGDSVRRINLDEQTLSRPLASRVESFSGYDEKTIVYTTLPSDAGERTAGYAATDIEQPVTIRTFPADDQPLHIAMKVYFNKRYVSILHGQSLVMYTGKLPTHTDKGTLTEFASQTVPPLATRLTVSQNGRFVTTELPDGYAVYDLELKKYDKTTWAKPSQAQRPVAWLDDYIVWSDNGSEMRIYDFDGANQQLIMPVAEGFSATLSPSGKYLYGITKHDDQFSLSRVQLIL